MHDIIFQRRHPEYLHHEKAWRRSAEAYSGGSAYIEQALIRHISEIEIEFAERRRRAYYFNYPRAIARRITQFALSVDPQRQHADPHLVEDWSRDGLRTNEVMRQVSTLLNIFGRVWLLVDAPKFSGEVTLDCAAELKLRPYARALSPLQVTDWAYGADGKLLWAILPETAELRSDPFTPPRTLRRCRLLERGQWRLFEAQNTGVQEIDSGTFPDGTLPLIPVVEPDGFGIQASHWFEDVVRISEAILNNESEAQMNVVKQMFGLLVVSEAFARGAQHAQQHRDGAPSFASTVARSAAVIEAVEEKGISRFISPSGVATEVIRQENQALKSELYDVVGLAVAAGSNVNRTAESKAWDFQNISQFLSSRADLLEQAETAAWELMHQFDSSIAVPEIAYNRKFAVRDLAASISGLLELATLHGGPEFHRAVNRAGVEMIDALSALPERTKQRLFAEIDHQTTSGEQPHEI